MHWNASFESVYFERALGLALARGAGLAFLHSHPTSGWQSMSEDDVAAEVGMAPPVFAATKLPLLGLTTAVYDASWSARFWMRQAPRLYEHHWCESVRTVGEAFSVTFAPHLRPPPVVVEELLRTVSAWGECVQADLARLRVGVVGLGSVGSIIAEALARIGVGELLLFDFDRIERLNRDRILHSTEQSIGELKVHVAAEASRRSATARDFHVDPQPFSICEEDGYRLALDCDILFSCVDRPWPRSILNFIAYSALIPVVDGGIHVSRTKKHRMRGADWKAHVAGSGRRCLECLGQYAAGLVAADREGYFDAPSYIERLPEDHPARANENVFAFSLGVAGLEMNQFILLAAQPAGVSDIGGQTYHLVTGEVEREIRGCEPGCLYPTLVARGDHAGHPGFGRHEVAETSRSVLSPETPSVSHRPLERAFRRHRKSTRKDK